MVLILENFLDELSSKIEVEEINPDKFFGLTQSSENKITFTSKHAFIALASYMKVEAAMPYRADWHLAMMKYYRKLSNEDKSKIYIAKLAMTSLTAYQSVFTQMRSVFTNLGFIEEAKKNMASHEEGGEESYNQSMMNSLADAGDKDGTERRNHEFIEMLTDGVNHELVFREKFDGFVSWYDEITKLTSQYAMMRSYNEELAGRIKEEEKKGFFKKVFFSDFDAFNEREKLAIVNGKVLAQYLKIACYDRIYKWISQRKEGI